MIKFQRETLLSFMKNPQDLSFIFVVGCLFVLEMA